MKNKCPLCRSLEIEAATPRTVYACLSSDYDNRPGTFIQSPICKGEEFAYHQKANSVIPMIVEDNGIVEEAIVCVAISGGQDYVREMPRKLTLVRILTNGESFRSDYIQDESGLISETEEKKGGN